MIGTLRTLMMVVCGAGLISAGALIWLASDMMRSPSTAGGRPNLLELLEEVRQSSPTRRQRPPARPAPRPPRRAAWSSPLAGRCSGADLTLQGRLRQGLAQLDTTTRHVQIHPTNFGERHQQDSYGNAIDPTPRLIVLHETVYGMGSAINTFRTPHPRDADQVSYHTLIGEDGQIVQVLDPSKRAYGAGHSAFNGEWVITNPTISGSVNNFALHLSLETPIDGEHAGAGHSGYSQKQYDAAAVVIASWMLRYDIPYQNITTHRHVDLGQARADPRSFDWERLGRRLGALGADC